MQSYSMQKSMNVRERSRETSRLLRQYVVSELHSGRLREGDKLPTERDLTDLFKVGRPSVRRALQELAEDAWIAREVGRGTFLCLPDSLKNAVLEFQPEDEATLEVMDVGLDFKSIARRASPLDVMELRLSLEPDVVELCVNRASAAEIDSMYDCLDLATRSVSLEEFEHADDLLHRTIAATSRNPLYVSVYDMISCVRLEAQWGQLKRSTLTSELKKKHFDEHVLIVNAIRDRNGVLAREEMLKHLTHIKKNMFG